MKTIYVHYNKHGKVVSYSDTPIEADRISQKELTLTNSDFAKLPTDAATLTDNKLTFTPKQPPPTTTTTLEELLERVYDLEQKIIKLEK